MSEPIVTQQPSIEPSPDTAELTILKQAHQEVLTKRQKDKARIAELESVVTGLQSKLSESTETIHQITIGVPLKTMAESMSTVPDLFLEQFSKHYKVEMVKGTLTLLSVDGQPVAAKDGSTIPFERDALTKLLTTGDDARAKTFQAITITNRASGAGGSPSKRGNATAPAKPTFQFGLR
ncbi:MAG: hypothetical protein WBQ94_27955 [Terracidiphilus sp.]